MSFKFDENWIESTEKLSDNDLDDTINICNRKLRRYSCLDTIVMLLLCVTYKSKCKKYQIITT